MIRKHISITRCLAGAAIMSIAFAQVGLAADGDGDLVDDGADNCVGVANEAQSDGDGDGVGDACDADYNNDGAVDGADFALLQGSFNSEAGDDYYSSVFDHNEDGVVDGADFKAHVALRN